MDLDQIVARLAARVPDLGQRVAAAADMAVLTASGHAPQVTPAAHVIPSAIVGGRQTVLTGSYVQSIERLFTVILSIRSQDASGKRSLPRLVEIIDGIILALAGWDLGPRIGVIVFRRCVLLQADRGAFAYEFTFSITDQLRIIT